MRDDHLEIPDFLDRRAKPGGWRKNLKVHQACDSTVEALMFSLRQRGAAALAERDCRSRLAELSTAQIRNVIERLIVARPRFPVIDDELLFLLSEQLA